MTRATDEGKEPIKIRYVNEVFTVIMPELIDSNKYYIKPEFNDIIHMAFTSGKVPSSKKEKVITNAM